MRVQFSSSPPLGQVTYLQDPSVAFTVVVETDASHKDKPWEVALWHSGFSSEWQETALTSLKLSEAVSQRPSRLQPLPKDSVHLFFSGVLNIRNPCHFTLKFRTGPEESWQWARDECHTGDGILFVTPLMAQDALPHDLSSMISGLDPRWTVKPCLSQTPRSQLWSLEAIIDSEKDNMSMKETISIGVPWSGFVKWFALVQHFSCWLQPRHGRAKLDLDENAVTAAFMSENGRSMVFLATSGVNNTKTVLSNNEDGVLTVEASNDGEQPEKATILVAVADEFDNAMASAVYHSRGLLMEASDSSGVNYSNLESTEEPPDPVDPSSDFKPEWMVDWYDSLGYCTWNALGQDLTAEKLYNAVEQLSAHSINIETFIIDDGWQSISATGANQYERGWLEFEAKKDGFPDGLKETVRKIRQKHPHIRHVSVWHALLGYWGGIDPYGELAKQYTIVRALRSWIRKGKEPPGGEMNVVGKESVPEFFDDFFRFLRSCGVDSVKTDVQFMIDTFQGADTRRDLLRLYLDSWHTSILRHFSNKGISCMSQAPPILFHSHLPKNKPAFLCRNSNDFYPHIPESHAWHLWNNAHNALFTQHLNIVPDWDMFQTVHDYSGFHAAARCISGGPIYITDEPGKYDLNLIQQMTGQTPRGTTVIFRPSSVGKSIDAYSGFQDGSFLKIGSYNGYAATGTPILGVFNIADHPSTELIPLSVFPGVHHESHYIIRAHVSGMVTEPVTTTWTSSIFPVHLGVRGYDIFTAYLLTSFTSSSMEGPVWFANLGLVGKMSGAAAILTNSMDLQHNGRVHVQTRLKALGTLGIYISQLPSMTIEANFLASIQGRAVPVDTVSVSESDPHVLHIDVDRAWREMGLTSQWSNEVEVHMYCNIEAVP